jgi:hypothetical protein
MPKQPDARTRRQVAGRAAYRCEYCVTPAGFVPDSFSIEHIRPRVRGGSHGAENLALSCQGCNNRKGAKTVAADPITHRLVDLYNPRTQRWQEHFQWIDAGTVVEGLTATGRATVECLQLNRPALMNLRWLLGEAGLHPPLIHERA